MFLYVIPIFTGLTLLAAAAGIYQLQTRNRRITDRLHRVIDGQEEQADFIDSPLPAHLRLVSFFAWIMPGMIYSEPLRWELAQAGYRHMESRKVYAGARVLTTALVGLAGFIASWVLKRQPSEILVLTLVSIVVGYFLPAIFLHARQVKRQMEITLTLPDALDLLVICVEAGQ
jgi:Flp pilus assembly protein TadB